MDLADLDRLGRHQHAIVTRGQLLAAGWSSSGIGRALRCGLLVRVHSGVFRIAGAPDTWRQAVMAAVLTGEPRAFAAHRTAIALHQLPRTRGGIIEIVSERHMRGRGSAVRSHRTLDLPAIDQVRIDGIPTVGIDRTLIDVGRYWPRNRVGDLLDEAVRAELTTYPRFQHRVYSLARQGRNGIGVARQVLAARGFDDGWGFEKAMLQAIRRAGLPEPTRQWRVETPEQCYYVDFAYPEVLLGIECDSMDSHATPEQLENDGVRQNRIQRTGVLLLRYSPGRLRFHEAEVTNEVAAELERRAGAAPPGFRVRS